MDRNEGKRPPCDTDDHGKAPFIVNINRLAKSNPYFRTALWTGEHLQVTLMSIPIGGEIGLEMHPHLDQFIRIEHGCAHVTMGREKNDLSIHQKIDADYAIVIPACTWHNIRNIGCTPLKLYSIYAPPQHPFGTVHKTKHDADTAEKA